MTPHASSIAEYGRVDKHRQTSSTRLSIWTLKQKKEIIAEITATPVKTMEQTVRESLKRTLPQDFLDKMIGEAVK